MIDNLLDNALRHARGARCVRVTAAEEPAGWSISVADDGAGVDEALRERIFERFVRGDRGRSARGGTGLGLALCSAIVAAHGGTVELAPARAGACFTVRLPRPAAPPAAPRRSGSVQEGQGTVTATASSETGRSRPGGLVGGAAGPG